MREQLLSTMKKVAKQKKAKILVCEGWDERCIQASAKILEEGLAELVILGNPDEINKKAKKLKADINKAEILDFKNSELKDELAEKLVELRKHKGMTIEEAKKLMDDENYFGCMYVHTGHADAIGGSAICPTAALMRPALQILRKKDSLVSEIGIMYNSTNKRLLFETDASLNIQPDAEQLAQMALNAAECVREFKIEPKIAMLSFSTKGSGGDNPQTQLVRDALEIVHKKDPELLIDGELQFDAALSPSAAKKKCPDSPLKGEANTVIFPDLNSSNIATHGFCQISDMTFEFTVLKGVQKPVEIFGRSVPMDTIYKMIICLAMQVNSKK
ncbi:MAG: phosphate acyltransferase [Candidatus Woesearchaeota archaeon]